MMNTSVRLAILAFAASAATTVNAQTRGGIELGGELFDYDYRERYDGEVIAQDDGHFGGFHTAYTHGIGRGAFLRARLSVAFGSVDYLGNGSILADAPEETRLKDVPQTIGSLEFHLGKDFPAGDSVTLTPYIGIGARSLRDNSGGKESDNGLLGYDREVSYAYVPVGVAATFGTGGTSSMTLLAQYNWFVGGDSKAMFSELDPDLPDVELEIEDGHGLELSAILSLPVGKRSINLGPFVRHWNIGQSKTFTITDPESPGEFLEFVEPKNRTTELGLRFSVQF